MDPARRRLLVMGALLGGNAMCRPLLALGAPKVFDVAKFGAAGDGRTLDSPAVQRALDAAAAYSVGGGGRAQVLVRGGGRRYLIGTLRLPGGVDFHLADDAQLVLSTERASYGSDGGDHPGALVADGARGLTISGSGSLQGRAREFMTGYDVADEWWLPRAFRPKMFLLTACRDLEVRGITFAEAPYWGLHMLGCEDVLVDGVTVRNLLDVPNCDGIDPDHSRRVVIRNCDLRCGDDAVVVKTSRQSTDYGPASDIHVHDCTLETQDAGLKVGTETTADVHDVLFERCHIRTSSRGLCIQLRDEGNVSRIRFRDITLVSRFFSDPWWGRGEAISFTAIPRAPGAKLGRLSEVSVEHVTGTAENSVRICGSAESRVEQVRMHKVEVTLDRTTRYPGSVFDNRPTTAETPLRVLAPGSTPGISIEHAADVTLSDCSVRWGGRRPWEFGYALEARDVTGLKLERFQGEPARAELGSGVEIL